MLQDRFHAETFVIEVVRPVLGIAFVIDVRDFPRDVILRIFFSFEKLAITSAFAAFVARRTNHVLIAVGRFEVRAAAAFAKFERQGRR